MSNDVAQGEAVEIDEVFGNGWYQLPKWYQLVLDAIADSNCDTVELLAELERNATCDHQRKLSDCLRSLLSAKKRKHTVSR